MAYSGKSGASRNARPKSSLKMQAIGFLSRREHSRQELRGKLLATLRKREREEAALAAASEASAREIALALQETPPNGIDDSFAPWHARAFGHGALTAGQAGDAVHTAAMPDPKPESSTPTGNESRDPAPEAEAEVDALLDWLAANGYLSDTRFVESRIHARAGRQGTTRIRHELAQHGLALDPTQAARLRETEFARAQVIWQRKFGEVATDLRERAKQARFLTARGFGSDVVRRIVGGDIDD